MELFMSGQAHEISFDDKKVVGKVAVWVHFTENDIDNIMVTCFEGGSNHWACLNTDQYEWYDRPSGRHGIPEAQWVTKILLDGKTVHIIDQENSDERWTLTLEKLMKGIELNAQHRPAHCDKDNWDAEDTDCILQYALFGKVVFG